MTQIEHIEIKELNQKIDIVLEKVTRLDERMENLSKCKNDHEERLRLLEGKPARFWGILVTAIITSGVAALIMFVVRG